MKENHNQILGNNPIDAFIPVCFTISPKVKLGFLSLFAWPYSSCTRHAKLHTNLFQIFVRTQMSPPHCEVDTDLFFWSQPNINWLPALGSLTPHLHPEALFCSCCESPAGNSTNTLILCRIHCFSIWR